eukprot:4931508-Pleurochrysis_carterae.AAC.4
MLLLQGSLLGAVTTAKAARVNFGGVGTGQGSNANCDVAAGRDRGLKGRRQQGGLATMPHPRQTRPKIGSGRSSCEKGEKSWTKPKAVLIRSGCHANGVAYVRTSGSA